MGLGFEAAKLPLTGLPAYAVAALKTILLYAKGSVLEVTLEHGAEKKVMTQQFIMVSIMNGRRLGGGFMTAPDGIVDDGLFDVCIVDQITRRQMLALIPRFLKGTQATDPAVKTYRAQRLRVRAVKGTIPAHADGETVCEAGNELSLELISGQLEMVTSITSKGSVP
jgi:diacylglycerol kinase (ATP)